MVVLGLIACCVLVRFGLCPRSFQLLLGGYNIEAKLVQLHPMQDGDAVSDTRMDATNPADARDGACSTPPPRHTRHADGRSDDGMSVSAQSGYCSAYGSASEHSELVLACQDSSLFPPDTAWESAAAEARAPTRSRANTRETPDRRPRSGTTETPVGRSQATTKDAANEHDACGTDQRPRRESRVRLAPRLKRFILPRRYEAPAGEATDGESANGESHGLSPAAAPASDAGSEPSERNDRRRSLNGQMGWLMRLESEAAFLQARAPSVSNADKADEQDEDASQQAPSGEDSR